MLRAKLRVPALLAASLWGCFSVASCFAQQGNSDSAPPATTSNVQQLTRLPATTDSSVVPTGYAQSSTGPPTAEQFADVLRRLEATEAELAAVKGQRPADSGNYFTSQPPTAAPDEPDVATLQERINALERAAAEARNKFPFIRMSGFFHLDYGAFSQDANSVATLNRIQNGVDFRRARLQALGNLTEFTRYSIEMDFGSAGAGRPSFMDVWGEQWNLPVFGAIRVGQFRQPIDMTSWTNIKHLEFLERSLPFQAFDPFRRVGIMAWRNSEDERSLLAYSVYGTGATFFNGVGTSYSTLGVDNRFGTTLGNSGGISFAIRGSRLVYYDELADGRYLLHVGGGYNFSSIGGNGLTGPDAKTYEARAIPEFAVGDSAANGVGLPPNTPLGQTPFFVDTGRFLANSYNLYHTELAGNYGAAHFQTEVFVTGVNQRGGPVVYYEGAYLQGGYFLTGESCGYNKVMGAMDYNVKPFREFMGLGDGRGMCGWGAWEIAARWSYLNLSSTAVNPANIVGASAPGITPSSPNPGILNDSTVALNWWWNQYTRVQFNWIHAMLNNNAHGASTTDIWTARYQIEF